MHYLDWASNTLQYLVKQKRKEKKPKKATTHGSLMKSTLSPQLTLFTNVYIHWYTASYSIHGQQKKQPATLP